MSTAVRFKQINVPRQPGEQARLKVVQGPDQGAVYVLTGTKATIGRGEDNDVVVSDLKTSRRHAEVAFDPKGWWVRDAGSANGILLNNKQTRAGKLNNGDQFSLGETTLEFMSSAEVGTQLLVAPPRSAAAATADHEAFEAQRKKVKAAAQFGGGYKAAPVAAGAVDPAAAAKKKRILLYGGLAALLAFVMLGGDEAPKKAKPKKKKEELARDLASMLPTADLGVTGKTADQFYKAGFREYRAQNFLRAKQNFETVLQMAPGHALATLYLENSVKGIEEQVKFHLSNGKRSYDAGLLKASRANYEAILRLLFRDQSNPAYSEAKDWLEKVNKALADGNGGTG